MSRLRERPSKSRKTTFRSSGTAMIGNFARGRRKDRDFIPKSLWVRGRKSKGIRVSPAFFFFFFYLFVADPCRMRDSGALPSPGQRVL